MLLRSYLTQPRYAANNHAFAVMHRLMDTLDESCGAACATPAATTMNIRLDVREDEKAYHVTADLPGLGDKDVDVTFEEGTLTIKGEKKVAREEKSEDKKATWHITERAQGSFTRKLALPQTVEMEKIEAKFDKGVLTVTLPKAAPEKPAARKIDVKYN